MNKSPLDGFLSSDMTAQEFGVSRCTVWRICRDNPGFAVRLGKDFKIPREHAERAKAGESVAAIAASVRARAAQSPA